MMAVARDMREHLVQRTRGFRPFPHEQQRTLHLRVPEQDLQQLETGVPGWPDHRGLDLRAHASIISRIRFATLWHALRVGVTINIVSSPATVPTFSVHADPSIAAATGCALPVLVFSTRRFPASRTSTTNSQIKAATGGRGGVAFSSVTGSAYPSAVLIRPSSLKSRERVAWFTSVPVCFSRFLSSSCV